MENVHFGRMSFTYDENDNKILISDDVHIKLRKSVDSMININIRKDAHGSTLLAARERAKAIDYGFSIAGNEIIVDEHLVTDVSNKARDQEVTTTIYVPNGSVVRFDESTRGHVSSGILNDKGYYRSGIIGYTWTMGEDGELKCQNCPDEPEDADEEEEGGKIIINEDGVDINLKDREDSFEMKINEDGIKVKAGEKNNN
jgi:hypothetical protein